MKLLLAILAAGIAAGAALADVRVPAIFSDGMVLQREATVPVWGWARPGEAVTVRGSWNKDANANTTAGDDGRWRVDLPTGPAGGSWTLTIAGDTTISVRDVLLGEVWLASGQSNMEWPVSMSAAPDEVVASATRPGIRMFDVKNTASLHPRSDVEGRWTQARGEQVRSLSAVGYHFAASLQGRLDVPIGIINADWGGTRIEAWMPRELLAQSPRYSEELQNIALAADPVSRAKLASGEEAWWAALDTVGPNPLGPGWREPGFDSSSWKTMTLPATFAGELAGFDGIVYFLREVDLPDGWAGADATIELGPIDDRDETFINGVLVGGTRADGQWNKPRVYGVPKGVLRAGRNTVGVRVYDTAGPGGINGPASSLRLRAEGLPDVPLAGEWRYKPGPTAAQLPPVRRPFTPDSNTLGALYDGMVHPLVPMRLAGVIWYQGESNIGVPGYGPLFMQLIDRWRTDFASPQLPFLFVQIAPYGYRNDRGEAAALREAQHWVARSMPRTGMVCTLDIGDPADIHPRDKKTVGDRLATLAMGSAYGDPQAAAQFPAWHALRARGSTATLTFTNAQGLTSRGGKVHVWASGLDRRFSLVEARIEGETLVVEHPSIAAVRYAWDDSAEATLWNGAGMPIPPFRTDDWPMGAFTFDDESFIRPLRSQEPGFAPLFNGKDLDGWVRVNVADDTFTFKPDESGAGVIHCTGVPTGLLRTTKVYENYELELEYRHLRAGGNAGVFVHADPLPALGGPFARAVEVQVMDGNEGPGYTSDGDIFHIWGATMTPENSRGGRSRAFPTERRANPAPRWNHYRIVCNNGDISLAVNGKVVSRGRGCSPRRGHIMLEAEGSPIDFRNIRLRELPGPSPAPADPALDGFVPLYNGVDLREWDVKPIHKGHWTPSDWVLSADGHGDDLWTKKSYRDFVLIADWRWTQAPKPTALPVVLPDGTEQKDPSGKPVLREVPDAGDSGIYLRGSSKNQVNMWCWPIGSGEVYGYRTDSKMPAEVRRAVTPSQVADNPIGQWNRFIITMKGDRLTVNLNGKTVIENAQLPGIAREGPIALQKHDSPVEFANILIKELPEE
jgi:sialate O-acetylesterase